MPGVNIQKHSRPDLEIGSPEWIAEIEAGQRANHPDWIWELWLLQPGHRDHLWEICPTEVIAKSLKRQLEKSSDPNPKFLPRIWNIRKRGEA